MFSNLSRFSACEFVEVLSKDEILATLDERGCVDGLPFMPEMFKFCGRRFRVRAVAHKTCETARKIYRFRSIRATVHLEDLRCDGSAHGGCEAECTLFWKDAWLKPVNAAVGAQPTNGKPRVLSRRCSEEQLLANTQLPEGSVENEPCYSCQATQLYDATEPIAWWDMRHLARDVVTGNNTMGRVLRVAWLASIRHPYRLIRRIPILRRLYAPFLEGMHRLFAGRDAPYLFKKIKPLVKTPTGRLDLKPGELVRVKSKSEIEATLDKNKWNRGLSFDPEEMARYCGGTFRVRRSVTKILDEVTGKMMHMKQPCIMLEGAVCRGEFTLCRLNCPRAIPCYWRELWLERVTAELPNGVSVADDETLMHAEALR